MFDRVDDPIELTPDHYSRLVEAKAAVIVTVGVEEKFDLLMENYVEYETQLLELAMRHLAFQGAQHSALQQERLSVTRRLVNLLSAARLYLDQLRHDLGLLFGTSHAVHESVSRAASEQYDARFGYRLMETLRNSVQHRSIAAISVMQHYGTEFDGDLANADPLEVAKKRLLPIRFLPVLNMAELDDLELKAPVKAQLISLKVPQVDLTRHIRDYIDGLIAVHSAFRKETEGQRSSWHRVISEAFSAALTKWPQQTSRALKLQALDSPGKQLASTYLAPALLEYLGLLEAKNRSSQQLSSRYVSGRPDVT